MTSRVRAGIVGVALGATLGLSACGSALGTDVAATVDGRVITQQEAADVARQINEAFQPQTPLTLSDAVTLLIRAPYINAVAEREGKAVTESMARTALAGGLTEDPTPSTIAVIQADSEAQTLTDAEKVELSQKFSSLKVSANPRYGSYDVTQAVLQPTLPDWISPHVAK